MVLSGYLSWYARPAPRGKDSTSYEAEDVLKKVVTLPLS
jgi:hypothetical protein